MGIKMEADVGLLGGVEYGLTGKPDWRLLKEPLFTLTDLDNKVARW